MGMKIYKAALGVVAVQVFPSTQAAQQQIKIGDRIETINGVHVSLEYNLRQVVSMLKQRPLYVQFLRRR
jgi:C-terminal processing protease CtpA/Prc